MAVAKKKEEVVIVETKVLKFRYQFKSWAEYNKYIEENT